MSNQKIQTTRYILLAFLAAVLLCGCGSEPPTKPASEPSPPKKAAAKPAKPKQDEPSVTKISDEAFRMAAYEGRTDTVRKALESGTDVNVADASQSLTALHMAAYNGHTHTVKLLLKEGASIDCRDAEGKTPLIHACTGPFAETVEILLEAGADVNARDSTESFTPLMMAAGLGQPEVVQVLLRHKADKTLVDDDNESATDHARNSRHKEIVEALK